MGVHRMGWIGTEPPGGRVARSFLEDADTVMISARARARGRGGVGIGFGEVAETILSAVDASGARREELAAADATSG